MQVLPLIELPTAAWSREALPFSMGRFQMSAVVNNQLYVVAA